MENSIKEDIERLKLCSTNQCNICGRYEKEECMLERNRCEQHILSDYKRVLKENEELNSKIPNLEQGTEILMEINTKLTNENEHYEDLICALETYYDITEEDLKECMKNDR